MASSDATPRWEYLLVPMPGQASYVEVEDVLNRSGEQGWELCGINYGAFIYKRRVVDE